MNVLGVIIKNCVMITVIGFLAGIMGAFFPENWISPNRKLYAPKKFEKNGKFYEKYFKITYWKEKVPEFAKIVKKGYIKGTLGLVTKENLQRFITETCRAELCHLFLIALSPVFMLFNTFKVGFILSILYTIGNLIFIFIQRYNRPRLEKLIEIVEKKEKKSSDNVFKV